jgi:hypothetical protein
MSPVKAMVGLHMTGLEPSYGVGIGACHKTEVVLEQRYANLCTIVDKYGSVLVKSNFGYMPPLDDCQILEDEVSDETLYYFCNDPGWTTRKCSIKPNPVIFSNEMCLILENQNMLDERVENYLEFSSDTSHKDWDIIFDFREKLKQIEQNVLVKQVTNWLKLGEIRPVKLLFATTGIYKDQIDGLEKILIGVLSKMPSDKKVLDITYIADSDILTLSHPKVSIKRISSLDVLKMKAEHLHKTNTANKV